MNKIQNAFVLALLLLLASCAGVGVVETSDPLTKLNDAEHLFKAQDRPLIAERLIFEALDIYQERKDNQGLGHAHREYADLLLSQSVVRWKKYYRDNGFRDKTVTYENRELKAKEYYEKALDYYALAEPELQGEKKYDALTNLYFNMAWSSYQLNDIGSACSLYDKSAAAYSDNIRELPDAKPIVPSGFESFQHFIDANKKRIGCA